MLINAIWRLRRFKTMKLLLLDLDGTVRQPKSGAKFISKPDDQELIFGVEEAIAQYSDWGIIGVTNQGGVAAGHKSLEDAITEQVITLKLIPSMEFICFCPDFEGARMVYVGRTGHPEGFWTEEINGSLAIKRFGEFRKPKPGMLNYALDWALADGFWRNKKLTRIDSIADALMVGDREEDQLAAQAASVQFMWADQWRSLPAMYSKPQG